MFGLEGLQQGENYLSWRHKEIKDAQSGRGVEPSAAVLL